MRELSDGDRALMILTSLDERASRRPPGKGLTRARLTSRTLKNLCDLERITPAWIERVNESLLKAGWILIDAGSTYGAIKVSVVENWPRAISSNVMTQVAKLKRRIWCSGRCTCRTTCRREKPSIPTLLCGSALPLRSHFPTAQ